MSGSFNNNNCLRCSPIQFDWHRKYSLVCLSSCVKSTHHPTPSYSVNSIIEFLIFGGIESNIPVAFSKIASTCLSASKALSWIAVSILFAMQLTTRNLPLAIRQLLCLLCYRVLTFCSLQWTLA